MRLVSYLSGAGYYDSTLTRQGAFRFTDTATNTEFIDDKRLFHGNGFAFAGQYLGLAKLDCFLRGRAMFFADHARDSLGIGKAEVLVKVSVADFRCLFLLAGKFGNGPCWADLTAKRTIIFTITNAGDEPGGKHPFNACGQKCWLERIANAHFHALPTADAAAEKICFRQGAGGADECGVWPFGHDSGLEKKRQQCPGRKRREQCASGQVKGWWAYRSSAKFE